jgi:diguanylate cyclase (GGDEF)-like protein
LQKFFDPNAVVLLVQATCALLMASLCFVLLRTSKRWALVYWSWGWVSLFAALGALWFSFYFKSLAAPGQFLYLLGEYVYGYLLVAGCRRYVSNRRLVKSEAWLLLPAIAIAVVLPTWGKDFNVFFIVHTLLYSYLFFGAYRVLRSAQPNVKSGPGVRVLQVALVLLALLYLHYAPIFAASALGLIGLEVPYLQYSPLYDLIFQVMLMFGMVMVVTGDVQFDLEVANSRLAETRDRLEAMAQLDHLTSALNRHAFNSLIENPRGGGRAVLHGCAALVDIDDLKIVNDEFGHPAGDAAIRAVASAIRSCIRADDLLFRWGGDEFLVLLFGVGETEARARLETLNVRLKQTALAGLASPVDLSAAVGFASFDAATSFDDVIAVADTAMYGAKRNHILT